MDHRHHPNMFSLIGGSLSSLCQKFLVHLLVTAQFNL